MGRRHFANLGYKSADQRSSIGDQHVDQAINELNKTQACAVSLMTQYTQTRDATVEMLFDPTQLQRAQNAKGLIEPMSSSETYEVDGVLLTINFENCYVPTMWDRAMNVQVPKVQPLLTYIDEVKRVHRSYEEVKGVLRWLNRNATPGAIRYYWPAAMKLCPTSLIWKDLQEVPTRYSPPPGIADWLQILKDAASTVTSMLMLPSDLAPKPRDKMYMKVPAEKVVVGTSHYTTDVTIYNL